MFKVIERIILWLATPILAIVFREHFLVILGLGAILIVITLPPHLFEKSDDSENGANSVKQASSRKRQHVERHHQHQIESDEEFLARMRYQEHSQQH